MVGSVRSYGQFCALARALDLLGDRWTLLIVRELLIRPCRYTDLRDGLPGIASNLLAERLRELERAGVVAREDAPPPVATVLYRLTDRGRDLRELVDAASRWGLPLMTEPAGADAFRSRWLLPLVDALSGPRGSDPADGSAADAAGPAATIQIETGDEPVVVRVGPGGTSARIGSVRDADLTLRGTPDLVLGVVTGLCPLDVALRRGLRAEGDLGVIERLHAR
jgi:DNA-binding HxlR family transcriptional regulator